MDEAIEKLRGDFIKSGRQGQHLMVNISDMAPDFINTYTNPALFDVGVAFNRSEWLKPDVHKAVLQEGENYSANSMSSGLYFLSPEWTMQIRSTAPNAQAVSDTLTKIPNIEQFKCIIME